MEVFGARRSRDLALSCDHLVRISSMGASFSRAARRSISPVGRCVRLPRRRATLPKLHYMRAAMRETRTLMYASSAATTAQGRRLLVKGAVS